MVVIALLAACGDDASKTVQATADLPRRPHVASASCPLKSPADWRHFLEDTSADESWVRTCSDLSNCQELVGAFAAHVQADVIDVIGKCTSDLADNPTIDLCTAHLRRYIPVWMRQHDSDSYGFLQDNATYLAAQTGSDEPAGMMDPPPALLAALTNRSTIEEAARSSGWPYVTHPSGLGGVRTFVTTSDPNGRFDQWMLVGLDDSATVVPSPSIMSFIGVEKKDAIGRDLAKVRLHFRDYLLTQTDGVWKVDLSSTLAGKCYACHGSGMRLLIPTSASASINARLLSYGLPDWNGTLDPADHGPPLGADLGCTSCHNGVTRGVLTVSTSEGMLRQKLVDQLSMRSPANGRKVPDEAAMALLAREESGMPALSPDEASSLAQARAEHWADYQGLVASRYPTWRAWVLDKPCE